MKPRIRHRDGCWECRNVVEWFIGYGSDPCDAYRDWILWVEAEKCG